LSTNGDRLSLTCEESNLFSIPIAAAAIMPQCYYPKGPRPDDVLPL